MKHFSILCLFASLLAPAFTQAQEPEIQTIEFSTLSWSRMIKDLHLRGADGELIELWIPNGSPSKPVEYRGTLPLRFFRILGEDAEGNPIEEVAAQHAPSSNSREQLLIFIEDNSGSENRYRILPIEFSADEIPDNQYRFINLSTFPVYVKFGSEQFKIDQRSERSMMTDIPEGGGQPVAMAIQVSERPNDVKVAYSSSWAVREGRSSLVFITTDPGMDERIKVKKLYF